MFVSPQEAADKCGITVERLEKISKRKKLPKNFVDDRGNYNIDAVKKMLEFIRQQAEYTKEYNARQKGGQAVKTHKTRSPRKAKTPRVKARPAETLDEFTTRFWETDEMWREFVSAEMNEQWLRYFIRSALEFGHKTAYPEQ